MKRNKFFLTICLVILLIGMSSLIKTEKDISVAEHRTLSHFPRFTLKTFLHSEYQNDFNDALSDQFVLSQTIKSNMQDLTTLINYSKINPAICKNRYVKINDEFAIFNCGDRFVYNPVLYEKKYDDNTETRIKTLKKIVGEGERSLKPYFYMVNNPGMFNFITNKKVYNFVKYFGDHGDEFIWKDYNEYTKYFYKTDHHWNYRGSYKGYTEVIRLLLGDKEKVLIPKRTIDFKVDYYGSMARAVHAKDIKDDFKAYKFDIPNHDEYVNGVKSKYGMYKDYFKGNIQTDYGTPHYQNYYGGDVGEVIYDFYDNKDKENLLIVGNSYQQAISLLVATHFHKTYVIDFRSYEKDMGKIFDYTQYIKENKIDKVIVIGDYSQFAHLDLGLNKEG